MSSSIKVISCTKQVEDVLFVERKGIGHPDTLADNLAEHLSRHYSRYTNEKYGAILHHNFDKLGILGGKSHVEFGAGSVISPIRVLINGRVSTSFDGSDIPYEKILVDAVHEFFYQRFGKLIPFDMIAIDFNISTASSPGHIDENEKKGSARNFWFKPRSLEDLPEREKLFSNDTSIGCGYYPLHPLELFVLELEKVLTAGVFAKQNKWLGTDVKIMGSLVNGEVDITLCVPQIANYVPSIQVYESNIHKVKKFLNAYASKHMPMFKARFSVNTRDDYITEELYLTATGSSIESGDEGLVGRGNRVNEIISINHPMSMEGASGKNPVYHIGKLYYIAAHDIAKAIYEKFDAYNEVYLVSQSGRSLTDPWKAVVKIYTNSLDEVLVSSFVASELKKIPDITKRLVNGTITIS